MLPSDVGPCSFHTFLFYQVFTIKWSFTDVSVHICFCVEATGSSALKWTPFISTKAFIETSVQGSRANKFQTLVWNNTLTTEWWRELELYCKFYWCLYVASCCLPLHYMYVRYDFNIHEGQFVALLVSNVGNLFKRIVCWCQSAVDCVSQDVIKDEFLNFVRLFLSDWPEAINEKF